MGLSAVEFDWDNLPHQPPAEAGIPAYLDWLRATNPSLVVAVDKGDGSWLSIEQLMFHYTMKRGRYGDYGCNEERWCYADLGRALQALLEWRERSFDGEPGGWRSHPNTGRRRNDDGDPASQWANDDPPLR